MSARIEKVNSLIKRCLSEIISNELSDPRLDGMLISVASVNTAPDLKYAKVYLSVFGPKDSKEVLEIVKSAGGYIKKLLAPKLDLRNTPALDFALDNSSEYSQKINKIISNLNIEEND